MIEKSQQFFFSCEQLVVTFPTASVSHRELNYSGSPGPHYRSVSHSERSSRVELSRRVGCFGGCTDVASLLERWEDFSTVPMEGLLLFSFNSISSLHLWDEQLSCRWV
uniref:Uncharacterized protein n=1 Tax=Salarias fasciatus TaxID=181472 RepID=A0A672FS72_SALFA